ncbi:metal ABC transporter substrate-binding protein [Paenibacillus fonticola]|uniref:metal ABC transporter substrate-binding protein n=1 Tax=Paenibacillus fonticola TaxID=379896 RepID=UPI00037E954A|nr:metal ABC transporter substrate-binding protein [Paenibacillus fonticola]
MNRIWNKGNKGLAAAVLLLVVIMVVAACGAKGGAGSGGAEAESPASAAPDSSGEGKLNIQVSFYPMYEFTKQVAGDAANVQMLVPSGVEPHDWEPTPRDIAKLEEADVFVYNGAGMEGWVEQVLSAVSSETLVKIEASHGLDIIEDAEAHDHSHDNQNAEAEHGHDHEHDSEHGGAEAVHQHDHEHEKAEAAHEHDHEQTNAEAHNHEHDQEQEQANVGAHNHDPDHEAAGHHDHDHGGLDPHVWLSPALAIQEVRNIEAGLSQAAPEHQELFKKNADAYVAKLEALDQEFRDTLASVKRKDFITQHAAFGYLAREYGLRQVPIAGLSPELEPSAAQMAEIVKFAKENEVKTIFFETLVSSKVAEAISKEIGAQTAVLNPIEGLTEEDLSSSRDYIVLMRQNLEALKLALNEKL